MRLGGVVCGVLVALLPSGAVARPAPVVGSVAQADGAVASEVIVHAYKRTRRGMECVVLHPASRAAARRAVALHEIETGGGADGLTITLVGTDQLEEAPEAKAVFIRAAQTWQQLIATPITVGIRVDFGQTDVGEPFG